MEDRPAMTATLTDRVLVEEPVSLLSVVPLEGNRATLQRILGQVNWEIHWAGTCSEALDLLRVRKVSVVLCEESCRTEIGNASYVRWMNGATAQP